MPLDWRDRDMLDTLGDSHASLVVRRFMPWSKAQNLLAGSLRFSPASWFQDPLEGHYPSSDCSKRDRVLRAAGFDDLALRIAHDSNQAVAGHNRAVTLISCWTTGPTSTQRFWSEYANLTDGIVVESTVGRIRATLGDEVLIAPVRYIDFDEAYIERDHSLRPFLYKSLAFQWEQEVRIIGNMERGAKIDPNGAPRDVPVDLNALLARVVVVPSATAAFVELVRQHLSHQGCRVSVDV